MRPTRRGFLRSALLGGLAGCATPAAQTPPETGTRIETPTTAGTPTAEGYRTIRVPEDQPTVQAGVDAADEGDLVLVAEGTYDETVEVTTPSITVRGTSRNDAVLDGGFERPYAVHVEADGVAVENLTARHYAGNGFYWTTVEGFRGSYLTAYNNAEYGIYAYDSRDGRFEFSYASGHRDAGFYLGRNRPFEAVITDVVAEHNALGYSGTSAGGDLTVRDSLFRYNMAGIVPNTLDTYDDPQRDARIVGNVVLENANPDAPSKPSTYPMFGSGILVWGGNENLIRDNVVSGHANFGIAAQPNIDEPSGNIVRGNLVGESGLADLALGAPAGEDNRFADNGFTSSWPAGLEADASQGDPRVTDVYDRQARRAERGEFPSGNWRDQPVPAPQPPMPDPTAPPRPARKSVSMGSTES